MNLKEEVKKGTSSIMELSASSSPAITWGWFGPRVAERCPSLSSLSFLWVRSISLVNSKKGRQ